MSLLSRNRYWIFSPMFYALLLGVSLGLVRPVFAEKLVFLADHFPPYEFIQSNGEPSGFDVEVIQAVYAHLNIPIEFKFRPWKRVVVMTKSGQATGMFSCVSTVKREEFFEFSTPISYATLGLTVKKNRVDLKVSIKKDLLNLNVGAISGFASNRHLIDAKIPFFKIPLLENAFPMLQNERFDGLYLSLESARFIAAENNISDRLSFMPITDIAPRPYRVCFSKKWPNYHELKEQFDQAVAILQASGKIAEIHDRY